MSGALGFQLRRDVVELALVCVLVADQASQVVGEGLLSELLQLRAREDGGGEVEDAQAVLCATLADVPKTTKCNTSLTDVCCGKLHVSDVILGSPGEFESLHQSMVVQDLLLGTDV